MSNLKQIGLGVMQYVQDYDETYPMFINYGDDDVAWVDTVQPYVKSKQVFQCPSSGSTAPLNGNYGANEGLLKRSDQPPYIKLAAVQAAASVYMIFDYGTYHASRSNVANGSDTNWQYLSGMGEGGATCSVTAAATMDRIADCQSGRHFGGVNMAFADGHVKWLKSSEVVAEARKPNLPSGTVCGAAYTGSQICTQHVGGAFHYLNTP